MTRRKTSDVPPGTRDARETEAGRARLAKSGAPSAREPGTALAPALGDLPAEFLGFEPTPFQQRLKARFWCIVGGNPMIDPEHVSADQVARICGDTAVLAWWKDISIRTWFLGQDTWKHDAEWLWGLWMQQITGAVLSPHTATKDLIALGNLLAKLTGRDQRPADDDDGPSPEAAKAAVVKAAKSLGMNFPDPVQTVDTPAQKDGTP